MSVPRQDRNQRIKAAKDQAFAPHKQKAIEMLRDDSIPLTEIRLTCCATTRHMKELVEELGIDIPARTRRAEAARYLAAQLDRVDIDAVQAELADLSLSFRDIYEKHGISAKTLKSICAHVGVDYDQRREDFTDRNKSRPKDRDGAERARMRRESLSGDGMSLEMLKKPLESVRVTPVVNSYFSGGGLMDIGLLQAGLQLGKSYEIDPTCCKVQAANLGDHVVQADISQKLVEGDHDCDAMVFTYPCTKYSPIADIHGTRTGDELFLHALRHLAIVRPEVYAVENVPGMRAFPIVMEAMTKMPDYYVQVFCPVNANTWLPQHRKRLIIIGSKRPFTWRPPEAGRRVTLAEILEDDPRVTRPKAIQQRMTGAYRDKPIISDPARGDIAPTCVAHYAKDKSTRLVADKRFPMGVRPYSVREWARLQGVPDWYRFECSDTDAYRMVGNGVPVDMGLWLGSEIRRYFGH